MEDHIDSDAPFSLDGSIEDANIILDEDFVQALRDNRTEDAISLINGSSDVNVLIESRSPNNYYQDLKKTPLGWAVCYNKAAVVKKLVEKKADVNKCCEGEMDIAPLREAVQNGSIDIVGYLLAAGAKLNNIGQSPLPDAARTRNFQLFKLLVDRGADVNVDCEITMSILAANEDRDAWNYLIQSGLDINQTLHFDKTLLQYAVEEGNHRMEEWLMEDGAKLSVPSTYFKNLNSLSETGIKKFISLGGDINMKYKNGDTLLLKAISDSNFKMVKLLLDAQADPNLKGPDNVSPLLRSIELDQTSTAKFLLLKGANPNVRDDNGQTPLIKAIETNPTMAIHLLQKNANPNVTDTEGMSALNKSIQLRQNDVAMALLEKGANPSAGDHPLIQAIQQRLPQVVEALLKSGANVDVRDKNGNSPLTLAFKLGEKEIIKWLVVHKVSHPYNSVDLLLKCIEHKVLQGVVFLTNSQIDINASGEGSFTPLTKSADLGLCDVVKLLIHKGAKIDQLDGNGKSPLDVALSKGNLQVVDLLITAGCDLNRSKNAMDALVKTNVNFYWYLQGLRKKQKAGC